MIEIQDIRFSYAEGHLPVLNQISLTIRKGEWVTLMGANGSGKSTLAMLILGLLTKGDGSISVDGLNPFDLDEVWEVRRRVGMVFQNPDTQMVSSLVEREIAFGPENYGMEHKEMVAAVNRSIDHFKLSKYRRSSPHELSGGERQRVALASGTVMDGDYLLLDEPTSLLDPKGRKEFLTYLKQLRDAKGILHITAYSEEALLSDRLLVLHQGRIVADGPPMDIFTSDLPLWDWGIDVPLDAELHRLESLGGGK